MSTLVYAALTSKREAADPGTSKSTSPPGLSSYVDALAALVPSEILALHGLILTATTNIEGGQPPKTVVTDVTTLFWSFFGLIVLSIGLYAVPRLSKWDRLDYLRVFIPPVAFVAWTMLQRATAFDAVAPQFAPSARTVIALFVAAIVGYLAAYLAGQADQKSNAD